MRPNSGWIGSLRHGQIRLFWLGQSGSLLGDRVYQVALSWIAASLTSSGLEVSLVLVAASLPQALISLFGGTLADRASGRRVMIWADGLRALLVAGLGIALVQGRAELWMLYAGMFLFGCLQALFQPASMSLIADVSPRELLPATNSLLAATRQVAMVAGPALAAALVAVGGLATPVLFDACTFILSVTTLIMLRLTPRERSTTKTTMAQEALSGWRELIRHPFLLGTSIYSSLGNVLVAGPWLIALPLLARARPDIGISGMGLAYSLQAVGALLTAALIGGGVRLLRPGPVIYGGCAAQGLALVVFGSYPSVWTLLPVSLVIGAGSSLFGIIWQTTLQSGVGREFVGRVSGAGMAISMLAMPVGFLCVGQLTVMVGSASAFALCGAATAVTAMLMITRRDVRGYVGHIGGHRQ